MHNQQKDDLLIQKFIQWGNQRADIRAVIQTSSRTNPQASVDPLSDYDVIVVVQDILPFLEDKSWLQVFGRMLVYYQDPLREELGYPRFAHITEYEAGHKIDFTFWPVGLLAAVAAMPYLPQDLDVGYRVLLDKNDLTADLLPPSYQAYIPSPPSEAEYLEVIRLFFHEATYVTKNIWRDELLPALYSFDCIMKKQHLRRMLEWYYEVENDWKIKTGAHGRGLKRRLPADLWARFEATYAGADLQATWEALYTAFDLLRVAGEHVGHALGYDYPHDLHTRVLAHLRRVQTLPSPGGS